MPGRIAIKPCACADEADGIRALVNSMSRVSFEAILQASDQVVALGSSTQSCHACTLRNSDVLLTIYARLVCLLEAAAVAYNPTAAAAAAHAATADGGLAVITCIPSPMFMGSLELNGRQSIGSAYDLIARRLRSLLALLSQVRHIQVQQVQARALRLLTVVSSVLERFHRPPAGT